MQIVRDYHNGNHQGFYKEDAKEYVPPVQFVDLGVVLWIAGEYSSAITVLGFGCTANHQCSGEEKGEEFHAFMIAWPLSALFTQ